MYRISLLAYFALISFFGCTSFDEIVKTQHLAPSFIVFLVDDQAWLGTSIEAYNELADYSVPFSTPNIDKLSDIGVVFTNAYACSPVCTPSRASIQTGMIPARLHVTDVARQSFYGREDPRPEFNSYHYADKYQLLHTPTPLYDIPPDARTVAERLKELDRGYRTAHFGKWHIGGGGPEVRGYDVSDKHSDVGAGRSDDPDNPKDIFGITSRAIDFIRDSSNKGKPFYLQISHHALHSPHQAKPETRQAYTDSPNSLYLAMTEDLDSGIGMILDYLEKHGLDKSTYVFYTSDNGANDRAYDDSFLRGGKWRLWEGGIRVPFIVSGPTVSEGLVSDMLVSGADILPTIIDLASGSSTTPRRIDGKSLRRTLEGDTTETAKPLIFHYPHYRFTKSQPTSAIRSGRYKLVVFWEKPDSLQLYDLLEDPGESNNIAAQHPDTANALKSTLVAYLDSCGAQLAIPNPDFSEEALRRAMSKQRRPLKWE